MAEDPLDLLEKYAPRRKFPILNIIHHPILEEDIRTSSKALEELNNLRSKKELWKFILKYGRFMFDKEILMIKEKDQVFDHMGVNMTYDATFEDFDLQERIRASIRSFYITKSREKHDIDLQGY